MKIADMNWMQVEDYLQHDDRAVLPIGSTEQHAQLSLMVDCILAERVAVDAAEPLKIPVFPPVNYGVAPYFRAYPGTISLRLRTLFCVLEDTLDSLAGQGFKRIVIVNGHGGNSPAQGLVQEWMINHPGVQVKFHNWWNAPKTWAKVKEIDPVASHASWMENFPWTRVPAASAALVQKQTVTFDELRGLSAEQIRKALGDGNFAGDYQKSDEVMLALWAVAVEETCALMDTGWQ